MRGWLKGNFEGGEAVEHIYTYTHIYTRTHSLTLTHSPFLSHTLSLPLSRALCVSVSVQVRLCSKTYQMPWHGRCVLICFLMCVLLCFLMCVLVCVPICVLMCVLVCVLICVVSRAARSIRCRGMGGASQARLTIVCVCVCRSKRALQIPLEWRLWEAVTAAMPPSLVPHPLLARASPPSPFCIPPSSL